MNYYSLFLCHINKINLTWLACDPCTKHNLLATTSYRLHVFKMWATEWTPPPPHTHSYIQYIHTPPTLRLPLSLLLDHFFWVLFNPTDKMIQNSLRKKKNKHTHTEWEREKHTNVMLCSSLYLSWYPWYTLNDDWTELWSDLQLEWYFLCVLGSQSFFLKCVAKKLSCVSCCCKPQGFLAVTQEERQCVRWGPFYSHVHIFMTYFNKH